MKYWILFLSVVLLSSCGLVLDDTKIRTNPTPLQEFFHSWSESRLHSGGLTQSWSWDVKSLNDWSDPIMSTGSAVVTGTGTNEDVLDTVTDADVEKLIDSLFDSSDL